VRRGDVVTLGRQHVKDGWLRMVPKKTRHKRLEPSEKPILPVLADVIGRSPTGDLTYLVTEYGKPFTASGFGNWFRARCDEAGLPHCSARAAQGRCHHRGGERRHRSPAHGAVRLDLRKAGERLYRRGQQKAACR
jgi:hypothetical protein